MRKKSIFILFLFLLSTYLCHGAFSGEVDLSKMTPEERRAFYVENKDYGKKKLSINYENYKSSPWIVFIGDYKDSENIPVKYEKVEMYMGGETYVVSSGEKGRFQIEVKKDSIKEDEFYVIEFDFGMHYESKKIELTGDQIISDSVYHFELIKEYDDEGGYSLGVNNVHNILLSDGNNVYISKKEKEKKAPSILGIQGIGLIFLIGISIVSVVFAYFIKKFGQDKIGKGFAINKMYFYIGLFLYIMFLVVKHLLF